MCILYRTLPSRTYPNVGTIGEDKRVIQDTTLTRMGTEVLATALDMVTCVAKTEIKVTPICVKDTKVT